MELSKQQKFQLLNTFEDKLVLKSEIIKRFCDVVHNEAKSEKIFNSLRKIGKVDLVFQKYYYIKTEDERINGIKKYSTLELIAVVLNKLNVKWYFGLESANDLNKVVWQPSKKIVVINNKFAKTIEIDGQKVIFSKIKPNLVVEFNKHKTPNRIQLNICSIDKTYIDYEYLNKICPIELKEKINLDKVFEIKNKLGLI